MTAILLAFLLVAAASPAPEPPASARPAEGTMREKRYPLGSRGTLVLQVPASWSEETEDLGEGLGPYIQFSGAGGPKESDFVVELFAAWSETDPKMVSPEWIARQLRDSRERLLPRASSIDAEPRPLPGGQRGACLSAALKQPRTESGERPFTTSCVVGLGGIALNLSISTDTKDSASIAAAIAIATGARLLPPG